MFCVVYSRVFLKVTSIANDVNKKEHLSLELIYKTIVILNEIDKDSIISEYEKQRKATENTEKKGHRLSVLKT